jgi:hypothetical protein
MNEQLRARRQEIRQRRSALRRELRARRRALRAAGTGRRRRLWAAVVVFLLTLLLLLQDCRCSAPAATPPAVGPQAVPAQDDQPAPASPDTRVASTGQLPRIARPSFDNEAQRPLTWLDSYRMQVSARSSRLAACFVGAARPGTLKWTASVEPSQGRVSDQTLEPTLLSDALSQRQRDCVFAVLADPPYQLRTGTERSTPVRVGMVIEF